MFPKLPSKPNFWQIQQDIIASRKKNKTFQQSIDTKPIDKSYRFYDGPPFITGKPHYGHLLTSTIKDVIPRYQTMLGNRVERVRGWDCHGIPVEQKVQKALAMDTRADIEKDVGSFINECYNYTKDTSSERNWYIENIGRWVDMDNAYRTMDNDFMESTLRVFKQLRQKNHIYCGKRVSLYSTKLSTPISSFEVAMDDSYEEINDPAITVMFDLSVNGSKWENVYALARTTTPWTIPCNIALALNKEKIYAKVQIHGDANIYIVAKNRVEHVFVGKEYTVLSEMIGSELVGLSYRPPFDYFYNKTGNHADHKVYHADFITDTDGTGIGHEAPEFGDVDFALAKDVGLTITEAMDKEGYFTDQLSDRKGLFYRDTNDQTMVELRDRGVLFAKASITHRIAFCPRSGVPLVHKAQDSRFIDIQSVKQKLLDHNNAINRYPQHFKDGRFAKSIETAPDWCISRTRFRGTPMPIRVNEKSDIQLVVGSRDEIFAHNKKHKQLTKIIFARHGYTDYNKEKRSDSLGKAILLPEGEIQAKNLATKYTDTHIDHIYVSPLQRCQDTIAPLISSKKCSVTIDDRLIEMQSPGLQDQYNDLPFQWSDDPSDGDHGESLIGVYKRVALFLHEKIEQHAGETILICSHGDPLVLMRKVLGDYDYNTQKSKRYITNTPGEDIDVVEYVHVASMKRFDLHKPWIDEIILSCPQTNQDLRRLPDVLDCWFESASMPYGQLHYPFENIAQFEQGFPADFIVEYTGQIRAWFYVMHVMGVLLFDKPAFKNVLCTGVMKGNDGRKMSKSFGNFTDPKITLEQFGGDAVRMLCLSSPVVYGGDVDVKDEGFLDVTKRFLLPLRNSFYFFVTYATIDGWSPKTIGTKQSSHFLDKWILSELQITLQGIKDTLDVYAIQKTCIYLEDFLENITNRYIRRSRRRFWKSENDDDKIFAYETLYTVLVSITKAIAPCMPFISEYIWSILCPDDKAGSVHLQNFPIADTSYINKSLSDTMKHIQIIVKASLAWRSDQKIRVRQPLSSITIAQPFDQDFLDMLADEVNVKTIKIDPSINALVTKIVMPDGKILGKRLGKDFKEVLQLAKSGVFTEDDNGNVQVGNWTLMPEEFVFGYRQSPGVDHVIVEQGVVVQMDPTITQELLREGYARDIVRSIQESRKDAGYDIADRIYLQITAAEDIVSSLSSYYTHIHEETLSTMHSITNPDIVGEIEIHGKPLHYALSKKI